MSPATTATELVRKLRDVITNSPYEIEIALQDGGHRYVARIFWPHETYPALLWDNPHQEIHSVERGRRCIEYKLCSVDQPTYEDLHYSGCDFWGDLRLGLQEYLTWLWDSQDPRGPAARDIDPSREGGVEEEAPAAPQIFSVRGHELVEKRAAAHGNSGRVYVPADWIGHRVAVIRLD